jgi:hypothetical protein
LSECFLSIFFTFSSFAPTGIWIDGRYFVEDETSIVDEGEYDPYDISEARFGGVKICPGTGTDCTIHWSSTSATDPDPVTLISYKGKFMPNILWLY